MKEILEQAEKLGYINPHAFNTPLEDLKKIEDFLNLCLIQRWLRTKGVVIEPMYFNGKYYNYINCENDGIGHETHDQALIEGVKEGLKMLEDD